MSPVEPREGARPTRVVKRYANRKLYDTHSSRYVTLQQVAELIREGEDVQIIDNTTKENLTAVTLAQILYEEEKKKVATPQAPRSNPLRALVERGQSLVTQLREGPVARLLSTRDAPAQHGGDGLPGADSSRVEPAPPSRNKRASRGARDLLDHVGRIVDERIRSVVSTALGHVRELQAEVGRLQRRIEQLERRLSSVRRRAGSQGSRTEDSDGAR
ncbi:MAG: polyhydroxyalkanoate synthesis regulator DNA-binding domain-containing protein [Myxococcota bacterium]|nr:polyhydroxyalkanoate synthesis regulator DNA-binding domain-containing protein [Myxococcota bacterium]MDW8363456.1 polyhydroxyalkanoate synthesis regulator DNA-binding domain-containing protein [Myxococcales bacterium]